ncbi:MAG: D-Ala-D-Ala carboxypeptidase family metallohydrolase, partial [candidate division WOR-3 bacterium]|nr:D-Ala-D-Ala carboxypeptidase family metallohydrolase [candidate division WOR-3 bacterium]
TLLYLEANREWQQVFGDIGSGRIEIQSGYRTESYHRRRFGNYQSAHVAGAAIDVLPPQVFIDAVGLNICIGYLCWLFRRAAQNNTYFREIVVLNRGQPNETRVPRMPKTLCEPGTAHISFGWLLHAVGPRDVRQDVLPSVARPYPVDANDSNAGTDVPTSRTRDEFQGPGRLDHLWNVFVPNQYANLNFGEISNWPNYSGGISAQWLAGYINEALNKRGWDFGRLIRQHHVGRLNNQDARIGQID